MKIDTFDLAKTCESIDAALSKVFGTLTETYSGVGVSTKPLAEAMAGKIFEAFVLARLVRIGSLLLKSSHDFEPVNIPDGIFSLLGSPGLADESRSYVSIIDKKSKQEVARIWSGVRFSGLSAGTPPFTPGDVHEADLLIEERIPKKKPPAVKTTTYVPQADSIVAVFECKLVSDLGKHILRNQLGLRREMSYLQRPTRSAAHTLVMSRRMRKFLPLRLPASQGRKRAKASHLFLVHARSMSATNPASAWDHPAQFFGLSFWSI